MLYSSLNGRSVIRLLASFSLVLSVNVTMAQEELDDADGFKLTREEICLESGEDTFRSISDIQASADVKSEDIPPDCSDVVFLGSHPARARSLTVTEYSWEPTDFFHQPVYFDDVPLEVYGQSICPKLQPIISGARFALALPAMPYKMGVDRTHDCVTTLGRYRPGSWAPCLRERLPRELDAALLQAGTVVGLAFLLP